MDSLLLYTDPNNNDAAKDKYSLRPRSMRRRTHSPDATPKKTAPLSKYRRKTANARERNRMREINQAFETLRRVIPHVQATQVPGSNEKLTKITTLRLAMKYIADLSAALNAGPESSGPETPDYSDLDCLLLESDGESLQLSDHSLLASPDFPEPALSPVDFSDPSLPALLHTDFTEHALGPEDFDDFFADDT
ncbi:transcription factor atoh7 [Tribolium castaneum]|uniref:Helix-loop-helix protein delilah-like Protein n=1 Tax=Tribolium castaneum TaxID=7070 RepID=D2A2Z8_TRICA|nr:Helix-loop-helix protein delilah-like Protein [Tribolium castaneum]